MVKIEIKYILNLTQQLSYNKKHRTFRLQLSHPQLCE